MPLTNFSRNTPLFILEDCCFSGIFLGFSLHSAVASCPISPSPVVGEFIGQGVPANFIASNTDLVWHIKATAATFIPISYNTLVDGFIAHEVSSVVPEAISGEKDAFQVWEAFETLPEGVSVGDNKLDDDGNRIPLMQSIDQSKLVPLLVKTIQELEARITALEA